ncbi:hydroxyacid dehydrogenase [Rhodococcus triatomae]|uniref:Phosphoglycerate dehydrogenase n=1 Tax=Rhodococcus triatomae TaxID=300028 RepID=A0A1G8DQQ9_9NOCA|nr:D-isomer specific 2-hydroxyacid dehydrogenase family protein [Rhodococcus triatomae]QNG18375.1 hydroxyacid dehydrogenase [Rhodococcus triatomae]QNG21955.1 hydroxyacid dehydrogenase [Rhodococcus triatomae]SDH59789.1 Phosphoglycerate dehydrogenase [Rhodococcus triatomae]
MPASHGAPTRRHVAVAIGPDADPDLGDAVRRGGGTVVPLAQAQALIWASGPGDFPTSLPDSVEWVQLPSAGVEAWFAAGLVPRESAVVWTSAAGVYSASVAEHALTLLLAGIRALPTHLGATSWARAEAASARVDTLRSRTVAVIGAGGIGRALIPMLGALGADVLAVNRSGRPVPGAVSTFPTAQIGAVWAHADHVVLSAPATAATYHLVGPRELAQLGQSSWVVNVARGSLVDTQALVTALRENRIGGAALDVTDPEPLPDDHPLWTLPNVIITPHEANPPGLMRRAYAAHVSANVARFAEGAALDSVIDTVAGY